MFFPKIVVAVAIIFLMSRIECHQVVAPAVRYTQVAPLNVAPFAAQVNTFTRGLDVFAAPYAAGVAGPAIVPRSLLPAPFAAAPAAAVPYAATPAVAPFPPAVLPAPIAPTAPLYPVPQAAPLVPAPFARSVHAALPGFVPGVPPLAPALPALTPALPSTTLLG